MAEEQEEPKHPGGRPPISEIEKKEIVSKLEPHLKGGLSISKALIEARVSKATFYRLLSDDEQFRDKINQFRNFSSILLNNGLTRELMRIIDKQMGNDTKGTKPQSLTPTEMEFLKWWALNNNQTKAEWGKRQDISLFDPEAEIQKVKGLIREQGTKEIRHEENE